MFFSGLPSGPSSPPRCGFLPPLNREAVAFHLHRKSVHYSLHVHEVSGRRGVVMGFRMDGFWLRLGDGIARSVAWVMAFQVGVQKRQVWVKWTG